jgi:hypothetical protein
MERDVTEATTNRASTPGDTFAWVTWRGTLAAICFGRARYQELILGAGKTEYRRRE